MALVCAAAVSLLALMVLVGWHLNIPLLVQVSPAFVPMQYNTALGFAFCGAGLVALVLRRGRSLIFIAGFLVLLGALTLIQYFFGINLGIDELLHEADITVKTSHPGRMSPNTALNFLLVGCALWLTHSNHALQQSAGIILTALMLGIAISAFVGYLANLEAAYGYLDLTRMAIHTAAGFIVIGVGLGLYASKASAESTHAWSAAAFILVSTFALVYWAGLSSIPAIRQAGAIVALPELFLVTTLFTALLAAGLVRAVIRLLAHRNALEKANESLKNFVFIAAHDLSEPARKQAFLGEALRDSLKANSNSPLADDDAYMLDAVINAGYRLTEMMDKLAAYARMDASELQLAEVDLRFLVKNIFQDYSLLIEDKQASVSQGDDLPVIEADSGLMRQILQALIDNALRYQNEGEKPVVSVEAAMVDGQCCITVRDNGCGIPDKHWKSIFEPCRRLHLQHQHSGYGLGLSIALRAAQSHGGTIEVSSRQDGDHRGSRFTVKIPQPPVRQ